MHIDTILQRLEVRSIVPPRLVRLSGDRPTVFVGDTHGDREATERVFARFAVPRHQIVFLGDVVDRGPDSLGNLSRILSGTIERPESIHLLMGNHEAWTLTPFSPADFWARLDSDQAERLGAALLRLPFAAWHPAGVIATHGALPDVPSLEEFEAIPLGSDPWQAVTWGDWSESAEGGAVGFGRRPQLGRDAFERRMEHLNARVLVRSHQPFAPTYLFDDRCLTVFTSSAYGDGRRRVAVLSAGRALRTAKDLDLIEL